MDKFNGFFEYTNRTKQRCDECEYRKVVYANDGWSFYGCFNEPYHGKRCSEIKECPSNK